MSHKPISPEWTDNGLPHLDVRGLEPPQPMVTIIGYLEQAGTGDDLIVDLDRNPIYLFPELAERGWAAEHVSAPEGNVRLHIFREGSESIS